MYDINSKIQVLDRTNVWRNGTIVEKNNNFFTIKFDILGSKDTDFTADMIRPRIEERIIHKSSLSIKLSELANLIVDDTIIYKIGDELKKGTVLSNDPFLGKIRLEENQMDINYEQICSTSKSLDFNLRSSTILVEPPAKKPKRVEQITINNINGRGSFIPDDENGIDENRRKNNTAEMEKFMNIVKDGFKTLNQTLVTMASGIANLNKSIDKIYQQQLNQQLAFQQQSLQLIQYQQEIRQFLTSERASQRSSDKTNDFSHLQDLNLSNYETISVNSQDDDDIAEFEPTEEFITDGNLTEILKNDDDENEEEYCSKSQILDLVNKCRYSHLFAAHLMEKIFRPEEFEGCNVYGKGEKNSQKKALDPKRVRYIQRVTNQIYHKKIPRNPKLWSKCVIQMNRRIRQLNRVNGKS